MQVGRSVRVDGVGIGALVAAAPEDVIPPIVLLGHGEGRAPDGVRLAHDDHRRHPVDRVVGAQRVEERIHLRPVLGLGHGAIFLAVDPEDHRAFDGPGLCRGQGLEPGPGSQAVGVAGRGLVEIVNRAPAVRVGPDDVVPQPGPGARHPPQEGIAHRDHRDLQVGVGRIHQRGDLAGADGRDRRGVRTRRDGGAAVGHQQVARVLRAGHLHRRSAGPERQRLPHEDQRERGLGLEDGHLEVGVGVQDHPLGHVVDIDPQGPDAPVRKGLGAIEPRAQGRGHQRAVPLPIGQLVRIVAEREHRRAGRRIVVDGLAVDGAAAQEPALAGLVVAHLVLCPDDAVEGIGPAARPVDVGPERVDRGHVVAQVRKGAPEVVVDGQQAIAVLAHEGADAARFRLAGGHAHPCLQVRLAGVTGPEGQAQAEVPHELDQNLPALGDQLQQRAGRAGLGRDRGRTHGEARQHVRLGRVARQDHLLQVVAVEAREVDDAIRTREVEDRARDEGPGRIHRGPARILGRAGGCLRCICGRPGGGLVGVGRSAGRLFGRDRRRPGRGLCGDRGGPRVRFGIEGRLQAGDVGDRQRHRASLAGDAEDLVAVVAEDPVARVRGRGVVRDGDGPVLRREGQPVDRPARLHDPGVAGLGRAAAGEAPRGGIPGAAQDDGAVEVRDLRDQLVQVDPGGHRQVRQLRPFGRRQQQFDRALGQIVAVARDVLDTQRARLGHVHQVAFCHERDVIGAVELDIGTRIGGARRDDVVRRQVQREGLARRVQQRAHRTQPIGLEDGRPRRSGHSGLRPGQPADPGAHGVHLGVSGDRDTPHPVDGAVDAAGADRDRLARRDIGRRVLDPQRGAELHVGHDAQPGHARRVEDREDAIARPHDLGPEGGGRVTGPDHAREVQTLRRRGKGGNRLEGRRTERAGRGLLVQRRLRRVRDRLQLVRRVVDLAETELLLRDRMRVVAPRRVRRDGVVEDLERGVQDDIPIPDIRILDALAPGQGPVGGRCCHCSILSR